MHRHQKQSPAGQSPDPTEIEIYASKVQSLVSAFFKAVAAAAFAWLASISWTDSTVFAVICGVAGVLLATHGAVQLVRAFGDKPLLVLNADGILDGRTQQHTRWEFVKEAHIVEKTLNQVVENELILSVQDGRREHRKVISLDLLEKEPAEVLELVRQFCSDRRAA